jgi:hypothetical protein
MSPQGQEEPFALSHNLRMAEALTAATAPAAGVPLLSENARHYLPLKEIQIEKFLPD